MLTGYTYLLDKDPLHFMRIHAMFPNSGAKVNSGFDNEFGTAVDPKAKWSHALRFTPSVKKAKPSGVPTTNPAVRKIGAGGHRLVRVVPKPPDATEQGAVWFDFAPAGTQQDGTWMPIYWLPWESDHILETQLPEVPDGKNPIDYPKLFFTAGLSGCSIFAHGSPESPTISHAGTGTQDLQSKSDLFWKEQMEQTRSGYFASAIRGSIHSKHYAHSSPQAAALSKQYLDFLAGDKNEFNLKVESNIGCVFGIRKDRNWTLYLQKSVVISRVKFFKSSEIKKVVTSYTYQGQSGGEITSYVTKKGGSSVQMEEQEGVRKIGPISIPHSTKIFSIKRTYTAPLETVEFYPSKARVSNLMENITAGL